MLTDQQPAPCGTFPAITALVHSDTVQVQYGIPVRRVDTLNITTATGSITWPQ
jgi:hypothetical protein